MPRGKSSFWHHKGQEVKRYRRPNQCQHNWSRLGRHLQSDSPILLANSGLRAWGHTYFPQPPPNFKYAIPGSQQRFLVNVKSTGWIWWSETWVGLNLFRMFHHVANSAKIPSARAELGSEWNFQNQSQPNPDSPCMQFSKKLDLFSKYYTKTWRPRKNHAWGDDCFVPQSTLRA